MTALSGSTVVVTGGAGFIGSHLVDELLRLGAGAVRVLDDLSNGSRDNLAHLSGDARLELVEGDIRDRACVERVVAGADAVFHLACLGVRHSLHAPFENHAVNALGSLVVLDAARLAGVGRFVYVSTSEVFGTAQSVPMDERHPTWPETVYGGSKLAGEAYARAFHQTYGMPTVVVRPFNTFGPRSHYAGDSGEVLPRAVVRVLAGLPPLVYGDGEQTRDFMYVTDTARAIAMLGSVDAAVGRTVNLGSGREITIRALCEAVIAAAAPDSGLEPLHLDDRPGDVRRLMGNAAYMRSLTGFAPEVSLHDGIGELVRWIAEQPGTPEEKLAGVADRNWETAPATPVPTATAAVPAATLLAERGA